MVLQVAGLRRGAELELNTPESDISVLADTFISLLSQRHLNCGLFPLKFFSLFFFLRIWMTVQPADSYVYDELLDHHNQEKLLKGHLTLGDARWTL